MCILGGLGGRHGNGKRNVGVADAQASYIYIYIYVYAYGVRRRCERETPSTLDTKVVTSLCPVLFLPVRSSLLPSPIDPMSSVCSPVPDSSPVWRRPLAAVSIRTPNRKRITSRAHSSRTQIRQHDWIHYPYNYAIVRYFR